MNSGVLVLSVPEEVTINSFADDLPIVATAKYPDDMEINATGIIRMMMCWLKKGVLTLADEKRTIKRLQ